MQNNILQSNEEVMSNGLGKQAQKKAKVEQTSYLISSRNYKNNNLDEKLP